MSPGLASNLCRTKISSRNDSFVLGKVACGIVFEHPQELESLTEAHHRATALSKISEFSISLTLTIHCNAKLVEDLSTQKHVNHLPALISGEDWELINKFLGVYSTYNPYMVE